MPSVPNENPPVEVVRSLEAAIKDGLTRLGAENRSPATLGSFSRPSVVSRGSADSSGPARTSTVSTGQERVNRLQRAWLETHGERLRDVADAIDDVTTRLNQFGEEVQQRIESEEYLSLVRKAFRVWDEADTKEKRRLIQKLLAHAGSSRSPPTTWCDSSWNGLSGTMRLISRSSARCSGTPGQRAPTFGKLIHGDQPREDSAEANLFKLLIHDLTTGRVIRQHRPTNYHGQFLRKARTGPRTPAPSVMKSAFNGTDPYELTELGKQFVHYTMNEIVPRMGRVP